MTTRVDIPVVFAAIAIFSASIGPAHAQDSLQTWPTRPIRLVVGAGAGGGTDIAARIVAQSLTELLGQPVVVENRPGAGGTTAAEAVAKSPKDGYTAYMMSNSHAISPAMYKALRYDPLNDFEMVSMVATAGLVLVTVPDFPAKDVAGVLAAVRANPGKFNFGSAGVGTTQQFAGELMKQTAGLNITHVPYRTTPAAVTGLRGKDVEFLFELVQTVRGQIQTGDLKAIAVTSPERNSDSAGRPDIPGVGHAGLRRHELVRGRLSRRHAGRDRTADEQGDGRSCSHARASAARSPIPGQAPAARRPMRSKPISPARSPSGKACGRRRASRRSSSCQVS